MHILHIECASYIAPLSHTVSNFIIWYVFQLLPKISLNVAQFAKDNNVFFEFFPNFCNIKHQLTQHILLRGVIKDGLYVFPPSTNLTACTIKYASYKPTIPTL